MPWIPGNAPNETLDERPSCAYCAYFVDKDHQNILVQYCVIFDKWFFGDNRITNSYKNCFKPRNDKENCIFCNAIVPKCERRTDSICFQVCTLCRIKRKL